MERTRCCGNLFVGLISLFLLSDDAIACSAEKMKTTEGGFIFRVVGGSNKIEAKKEPGSEETAFTLELLAPYFVICEEDKFYKVTDLPAETVAQAETGKVGYVLKEHVHPWPTREALNFSAVAFTGERPEIVAWDDQSMLKKFLDTGNMKLAPPAFREDLESTLKRERAARPYPVLGSKVQLLRNTVEKRVFDVLLPVALPPQTKVVIPTDGKDNKESKQALEKKLDKVMTNANFVIAFDATDSMAPFTAQFAADIKAAFDALPTDVQKASTVGIVFFRDEGDAEKYAIVPQASVTDAMKVLTEAATPAYMKGGGGRAVPVLDAVYLAHHLFPWNDHQQGRRIIVVILGHDAQVVTRGKIHDGVPAGLDADQLAADLRDDGISVVTVQAGPQDGKYLMPILTTLAVTTKGEFVEWGAGGDERRERVIAAVAAQLTERAESAFKQGKKDLAALEFDYGGYSSIPFKVLADETLQQLRDAGANFNIDPEVGGVLIRHGLILENHDLLELQIQVDKKFLETLIDLFSVLGVSGMDAPTVKESTTRAMAAIAGDGYDPNEPIEALLEKRLGFLYRRKSFDFESIAGMNRSERLEMAKRMQNAAGVLGQFLDDNLEALERNQTVWMPAAMLP